ncbi:hypothetical protein LCGC14_0355060 [marine sediment metagenome]|uniref:Uncharacterized protein n=1 Tax=marine sediment metagenome TaxID=412755 RepID=A0A0F9VWV6_9ZZZZ
MHKDVLKYDGRRPEPPYEDPEPVCCQCGAALDEAAPPLCEDCQDRERLTPPDEL